MSEKLSNSGPCFAMGKTRLSTINGQRSQMPYVAKVFGMQDLPKWRGCSNERNQSLDEAYDTGGTFPARAKRPHIPVLT
jgi:hypothetical protein